MLRPLCKLLITGSPRVGKTTLIRKVVTALGELSIGGFYTEEVREGGIRQGFRLVTFSGAAGVIAHVNFNHRYAVGKYGVDVAAIDRFAERALLPAVEHDLYVVDEIGEMECYSPRFIATIQALLAGDNLLVATVAKQGTGLIEEVKRQPGCEVWEVTGANRDRVVADILAWLKERL